MPFDPFPGFFCLFHQFEDHGECCQPRPAAFRSPSSVSDGGEGGFDRIGRSDMDPVLGREVVEREKNIFVLPQTFTGPGELFLIEGEEGVVDNKGLLLCRRQVDVMEGTLNRT